MERENNFENNNNFTLESDELVWFSHLEYRRGSKSELNLEKEIQVDRRF